MPSKIFLRNRALGYVSNHVPLVTRYIQRRKENLIVTCVGKTFHTYGCSHFALLSVSGEHEDDISCLAADTYHIYTASGNNIYAWRRGNELKHTYKAHKNTVHTLLPFGAFLLSVDEESNLKVWDVKSEDQILQLTFCNAVFKITTLAHPSTYMNKILVGSEQGQLQLWNIKIAKMIYVFKGWGSAVSVLEQAPAIDVMAIGLASGKIVLHNLKHDETLFELFQDWGFVTSITFRSDGEPIMATGSMEGHVTLWNLEKRKVESQILNAHFGSVAGLKCLPNEPLIVSSSPDNSLKLWIFDLADGAARLLRIREGHAQPPTFSRFYGEDGANVLTASEDASLRIFSTITETFNKSLGRASWDRKASKRKGRLVEDPLIMKPIVQFAAESTREKDWDNIAAAHAGLGVVTTWSYDKLKMGEHKLLPEGLKKNENAAASSVCVTHCGNFVLVGYTTGHVERFNIQSGIHRASYGSEKGAHKGSVKGIAVDALNQTVLTAGRDCSVKFWPFKPRKGSQSKEQIKLDESVEWLRTHRESSLVAIALEDFNIVLMDMDTRRIVRQFQGHTGRLTDATFSPDCRWLLTASMDCTIRTWDIPSAQMVDIFQVKEACVCLHFSPTGEFLLTSHICNLGLYLWSNRTLFSHVSLKAIDPMKAVPTIALPGSGVETEEIEELEDENLLEEEGYTSVEQIDDLVTMTSLASSRWLNLLDIDIVKKRNKPKNAPKVPESAPFFLPTVPSLEMKFDFSDVRLQDESDKCLVHPDFKNLTPFGRLLESSVESGEFSGAIEMLKSFGPSAVDFEIQSLDFGSNDSVKLMLQFIKMIRVMFESHRDFEISQSYLGLFLKKHGPTIVENETLRNHIKEIENAQRESWALLQEKLFYNLSAVQHLKKV